MWHKLREIFGYKDSRRVQNEVLNTEIQEITIGNDTIQESDMENNENHVSNNVKSNMERIDKSSLMKYKEKWEADECFECQVTASLVTFGMVAHICYSLWQKRVQLPPNKVKYIVMANASLFGIWLCLMKHEWYDKKQTTVEKKQPADPYAVWDRFR